MHTGGTFGVRLGVKRIGFPLGLKLTMAPGAGAVPVVNLPTWHSGDGEDGKETIVSRRSLLQQHFNPPTKIEAAE